MILFLLIKNVFHSNGKDEELKYLKNPYNKANKILNELYLFHSALVYGKFFCNKPTC